MLGWSSFCCKQLLLSDTTCLYRWSLGGLLWLTYVPWRFSRHSRGPISSMLFTLQHRACVIFAWELGKGCEYVSHYKAWLLHNGTLKNWQSIKHTINQQKHGMNFAKTCIYMCCQHKPKKSLQTNHTQKFTLPKKEGSIVHAKHRPLHPLRASYSLEVSPFHMPRLLLQCRL